MNNNILDHLPTKTKRALLRWYTISCALIIITFVTLAIIHTVTVIKLSKQPVELRLEQTQLPDRTQEIATVIESHTLLKILEYCIQLLDPHIQLTKLTVNNKGTVTCVGKISEEHDLARSLELLQKEFDINSVHTQTEQCTITMTYRACKK